MAFIETLAGTLKQPLLRDDNPMLVDIHCMEPRPRYSVRQGPFARLRPLRFEKELRNDGVSGASGPSNDGILIKSGIRDTETGCQRCFTTLKWEIRSRTDIKTPVRQEWWNGARCM